jgi:hypothetical protein
MSKVLLGNTFPLTLVRRGTFIEPVSLETAKTLLEVGFASFWGHANTAAVAKAQLGFDVAPKTERPALKLNEEQLPTLDGDRDDRRFLDPKGVVVALYAKGKAKQDQSGFVVG